VCEAAARRGLHDPGLTLAEASARFAAGEATRALSLVETVLAESPGSLAALYLKAHLLLSSGRRGEARVLLDGVVERFPDFPGAQAALSALLFPGPRYREVLLHLHRALRPDTYLEIGVVTGATLALAQTASLAVGVDPAAAPPSQPLPSAARLYRLTSDEFFARETPASAFSGRAVDFTFIDGMHWFEFALRDFANAERWASPEGTIVLHDCLPVTPVAAARDRASTFWVGDVWKVLEVLVERRPDLRIAVVPTAPSGLVVVRRLDPASTVLARDMDSIVAHYRDRQYPHVPGEWPASFGVVGNDAQGIARALA
jgi:hypothetical protein